MKTPFLILALALTAGTASSQAIFTSSGTWTAPAGVTSVTVEVVGAGGSGTANGRGGGGGGGYASGTFTVVPATVYTITVGTGGSTTATSVSGLGIQATAGANAPNTTAATGGAGGVGTGGTVNRTGGTGGTGTYTYFGGGGGGAAGASANGGNGGNTPPWNGNNCLQPGGAAGASGGAPGGAGGKGAGFIDNSCNVADPAAPGGAYGGGGGGGNGNSSPAAAGGNGYVVINFCTAPAAPVGTATQTFCSTASPTVANLAATGSGIQWYASATGGTPLAANTPLVNNTSYFASQTVSGCVSSTRLQVVTMVVTVNATATAAGNVLTAGAVTGGTYQWINCANKQVVPNAATATYTAAANGSYAVVVTVNGCRDTSSCVTVSGVGVEQVQGMQGYSLYPNPARDVITVQAGRSMAGTAYYITDAAGKKVRSGRLTGDKTEISIRDLPTGIYHFSTGNREQRTFTIQKQ